MVAIGLSDCTKYLIGYVLVGGQLYVEQCL